MQQTEGLMESLSAIQEVNSALHQLDAVEKTDCAKKALRSRMYGILKERTSDSFYCSKSAQEACRYFCSSSIYQQSQVLLVYMATGTELGTIPLIKQAWTDHKRVAVPLCELHSAKMEFFFLDENKPLEQQLVKGAYGILEPAAGLEQVTAENLPVKTTVVVPGVAFSLKGDRLGHGKGYYDRYIQRLYHQSELFRLPVALVGWCFSCQIQETVPVDEHDIPMTALVTEHHMVFCEA